MTQQAHPRIDTLFGGSVYCDLVFTGADLPGPGEEVFASGFALTVGGTANRCVAAARLGVSSSLVAVLGDDPLSGYVRGLLADEIGLCLDWVETKTATTIPVTVALTDEVDRSFITYEEQGTGMPHRLARPLPQVVGCDVGLVEADVDWVVSLRERGTLIYAGVGWDSSGAWAPETLDYLDHVDVFIPNEVEAVSYTRTADSLQAAKALAERVGLVVVTKGKDGVVAIDSGSGEQCAVDAVAVRAVDPTGAGDVFSAAFMAAAAIGWPLLTRLRFASLSASLSVRTLGGAASSPRPADILNFLRSERPVGDWADIEDWAKSA